jgi:acetyl/propionyl-CoA carboxylase alpha subunit
VLPAQPPEPRGHSIEARLYAEDPAKDWQPQAGTVSRFDVPAAHSEFASSGQTGIRLDAGIVDGSEVSIHYDPMLAKVISYAPTRRQSAALLADALARTRLHGVHTNRDLLVRVLRHPSFLDGATDTAFFDTHGLAELAAPLADARTVRLSAVAAAIAGAEFNRSAATVLADVPSGWRNLRSGNQVKTFRRADDEIVVEYRFTRAGVVLPGDDTVSVVTATPDRVVLADAAVEWAFDVARDGSEVYVNSPLGQVALSVVPRFTEPGSAVAHGSLVAPMPGLVIRVGAQIGDTVAAAQPLIWLEAMKMEHTITAPTAGVLTALNVKAGEQVEVGAVLAHIEQEPAADGGQE